MKNISIKTKIILLTIIPLIVVSWVIIYIALNQAKSLGSKNIDSFSNKIFELRRMELKNYTDIAVSAVKNITNSQASSDVNAQETVKDVIRNLRFGDDGYFYAYDRYTTLAHPTVRRLEGNDQRDMTDPNGVKIIQELYQSASTGGGYTSYVWLKPSRSREVEKIGYSNVLDGWDWWIGTGLYVDDLEDAVISLQKSVDDNIHKTLQIIFSLALAAVAVVGLISSRLTLSEGKVADQKLEELSSKSVDSQESERGRVARQLQSAVLQNLNLARSKLRDVAERRELSSEKSRADFIFAIKEIQDAMLEVRNISSELRPATLDKLGLEAAIIELIDSQKEKHSNIKFSYQPTKTKIRINPEIEIVLYRIIQAALANVVDHSQASTASVSLNSQSNKILLSIKDDGIGFDIKDKTKRSNAAGIGLIDMRVRAESLGGHFSVSSKNKAGTHISIEIPI